MGLKAYIAKHLMIGGTSSPTDNNARLTIVGGDLSSYPSAGSPGSWVRLGYSFGVDIGVRGTGNGWIQVHRFDGTPTTYHLILQPAGGSVGIGTSSPAAPYKLDIAGACRAANYYSADGSQGVSTVIYVETLTGVAILTFKNGLLTAIN